MATRYTFSPSLEEVEDAIIAALRDDAVIAAYARSIVPFQGDMDQALAESAFADPALLVLHPGGRFVRRGSYDRAYQAQWTILLRAHSLRGNGAQRNPASAAETGAYRILQDVVGLLQGSTLDLTDLEPIECDEAELLATASRTDRTRSVYMLTISTVLQVEASTDDEANLEAVQATYEVANPNEQTGATEWPVVATETVEVEHD